METKTKVFCHLLVSDKIAAVKLLRLKFDLSLKDAKFLTYYIEDK